MYVVRSQDGLQFGHLGGRRYARGRRIGARELPAGLVSRLLAEGAIAERAEPEVEERLVEATAQARALAEARGVPLAAVAGRGAGGRVRVGDVRAYLAKRESER